MKKYDTIHKLLNHSKPSYLLTLLAFTYSLSATSGDIKFSGSLYVSDCSVKSANDDKITCSLTFAITGAVTIGTV